MNALYSLRNLTRRFGGREVLTLDSLDIRPHEIYALLGPNGAGKSTLMRILAFLDTPTSGELFFRGAKVPAGQEARFRPGVVWVPQYPVMFTGTLLYNIEYPMALKNVPQPGRKRRALELLESVNLAHLATAPAHKLSGGESQRASIARALAAGAEVILFDEPTANVDQRSLGDFIALVEKIWEQRKLSILITTHNAALAAALCRRRIFLAEGKLARRQMLPGGDIAWPATLVPGSGCLTAFLPPEAVTEISGGMAWPRDVHVRGIMDFAAGVGVRLEIMPGHVVEIIVEDETGRNLARAMTLGCAIKISPLPGKSK